MKQRIFILIVGIGISLSFSSCQKSYTCECTTSNLSDSTKTTNSFIIHEKKKKAQTICQQHNAQNTQFKITCHLK